MTERTNMIIIVGLIALAAYGLYLGRNELAATCAGALATALTTIMRSKDHDKIDSAGPTADDSPLRLPNP